MLEEGSVMVRPSLWRRWLGLPEGELSCRVTGSKKTRGGPVSAPEAEQERGSKENFPFSLIAPPLPPLAFLEELHEGAFVGGVRPEGDGVDAGRPEDRRRLRPGRRALPPGLPERRIGRVEDACLAGLGVAKADEAADGKRFFARVGERDRHDVVAAAQDLQRFVVSGVDEVRQCTKMTDRCLSSEDALRNARFRLVPVLSGVAYSASRTIASAWSTPLRGGR